MKTICDTLKRMMNDVVNDTNNRLCHQWRKYNDIENKEFLKKIQKYGLQSFCETDKEVAIWNECIIEAWVIYAKCLDEQKKW